MGCERAQLATGKACKQAKGSKRASLQESTVSAQLFWGSFYVSELQPRKEQLI